MRTLLAASLLLLVSACARSGATRPTEDSTPEQGTAPRSDARSAEAPLQGGWTSPLHRDHPLTGRIWDVKGNRFVDEAELLRALAGARFVVLGERHDQGDHHQLQAKLVRALASSGRKPALAFEMLDVEQQPAVDASLARAPR
ncbi:ChaN family lipoprotein, partial [Pyxidicoccus sp. 3LFB2]